MTMPNEKNESKLYALIAGICYGIYGLYSIISELVNEIYYIGLLGWLDWTFFDWLHYGVIDIMLWLMMILMVAMVAMLIVAPFRKNREKGLFTVAIDSGLIALFKLYYLISWFSFTNLLDCCAYLLVALIIILSKKKKVVVQKIWFLPGATLLLGWLIGVIAYGWFSNNWVATLFDVFEIGGFVLIGLWLKETQRIEKEAEEADREAAEAKRKAKEAEEEKYNKMSEDEKIEYVKEKSWKEANDRLWDYSVSDEQHCPGCGKCLISIEPNKNMGGYDLVNKWIAIGSSATQDKNSHKYKCPHCGYIREENN